MKKILVADDDLALRKILSERFTKEGWDTKSAIDGNEVLQLMRENDFDVVLLDMRMPHKDGFAVLEELKADPSIPRHTIIVLSGSGEDEDIKKAINLGATDYFVKADDPLEKILKWADIYRDANGGKPAGGDIHHSS